MGELIPGVSTAFNEKTGSNHNIWATPTPRNVQKPETTWQIPNWSHKLKPSVTADNRQ